jgi:hypothetical protein
VVSDKLTVMVVEPVATPVIVIVFPLTLTIALDVSFEIALIVPSPFFVTVTFRLGIELLTETLLVLKEKDPEAFAIVKLVLGVVNA